MPFVVEDSTGLPTANAYISVADADTHQADRGRTDWAAAIDADKEVAIVRATDYIDQRFALKFVGDKGSSSQALEWPRLGAYDDNGYLFDPLPAQLLKACAEYALISLRQGELGPNPQLPVPDASPADGSTTDGPVPKGEITKEVIGPMETEWQPLSAARGSGAHKAAQSTILSDFFIPEYPVADLWIEDLLESTSSRTLVRA